MQTLDNLMMNNKISLKQYLERVPNGYIAKKQELINELGGVMMGSAAPQGTGISKETMSEEIPVAGGSGNAALQRAINREGV